MVTKYKKGCEKYFDERCHSTHEEKCRRVPLRNCSLQVKNDHHRKCETVQEKHCYLKRMNEEKEVQLVKAEKDCHQMTSKYF